MEFQEAAVHYAFPIVCVIVCCLLVFAFGFKSPGQPPSFDIVDVERKVVKKRKGKENQKVKPQQNGKVTTAVPTKVEAAPHTPKAKAAAEKQVNKSEAKQSNKKSRSQQASKQVDVKHRGEVVQSEDGNEDGWVQQVSKKERKNRKKDDVPNSTDVTKTAAEIEASSEIPEKAANLKEEVIQAEKEKLNDSSDSAVEKEPLEDTNKSTPKAQRTPKKKKGKKDEEVSVESSAAKEPPIPEVSVPKEKGTKSESKSYSSVTNKNAVIELPSDDLIQVQDINDVSEEEVKSKSKKKKSKKKGQETAEIEDVKTETKIIHAQVEHNKVVEQQTVPKKEITIEPKEPKLIEMELQDGGKKGMSNEPSSTPGSNVAFDELKDLCPEEKPQKKKKKVRREH